jgi:hypothetical protein
VTRSARAVHDVDRTYEGGNLYVGGEEVVEADGRPLFGRRSRVNTVRSFGGSRMPSSSDARCDLGSA